MAAALLVVAAPVALLVLAFALTALRAPGVPVRRVRPGLLGAAAGARRGPVGGGPRLG